MVREVRLDNDRSFDALMRLADCWQQKWDRRRHLEWNFTFAVWAVFAVAFVCASYGARLPLALPMLIFLAQAYIVTQIRLQNDRDGRVVLQLRREAEAIAHRPQTLPEQSGQQCRWRRVVSAVTHYSTVAQIAPTAFAALVLTQNLWNAGVQ
ncbi:MAG TPA: hypothetical protein VGL35_10530 [Rhizomicrobium sp.]